MGGFFRQKRLVKNGGEGRGKRRRFPITYKLLMSWRVKRASSCGGFRFYPPHLPHTPTLHSFSVLLPSLRHRVRGWHFYVYPKSDTLLGFFLHARTRRFPKQMRWFVSRYHQETFKKWIKKKKKIEFCNRCSSSDQIWINGRLFEDKETYGGAHLAPLSRSVCITESRLSILRRLMQKNTSISLQPIYIIPVSSSSSFSSAADLTSASPGRSFFFPSVTNWHLATVCILPSDTSALSLSENRDVRYELL